MKTSLRHAAALGVLALLTGCATPGPYRPQDTNKYTLENSERFVLLDREVLRAVTCTKLQENELADGRLEIVADVKNRLKRRIEVQINCVFKDRAAMGTGDETPFETLILSPYETKAVRFTSFDARARAYTIRVRQSQ